jgi:hypothetical protein
VFLKEHLWKSGKKRQHGKRIRMMDLGAIAKYRQQVWSESHAKKGFSR